MEDMNLKLSLAKRHHKQFCNEIEEICQKYETVPTNASLLSVSDGQIIDARKLESKFLKKIYFGDSASTLSTSNSDEFDFASKKDVTPLNLMQHAPDDDKQSVYSASSEENDVFTSYTNFNSNKSLRMTNKDLETMSVVSVSHFQGIAKVSKAINNDQFSTSNSDDSYCSNSFFDSKESLSLSSDSTGSNFIVDSNGKVNAAKSSIFDFPSEGDSKLSFSDSCSDKDPLVSSNAKRVNPQSNSKCKENFLQRSVVAEFDFSHKSKDFDILESDVSNFQTISNIVQLKKNCSKADVLNTKSSPLKNSFIKSKSCKEKCVPEMEARNIPSSGGTNISSKHYSKTPKEHIYSDPLSSEPLPNDSPKKSCSVLQKNNQKIGFSSPSSLLCSPIKSINLKADAKARKRFDRRELLTSFSHHRDGSSFASPESPTEKELLRAHDRKSPPRLQKKQVLSNRKVSRRQEDVPSLFDFIIKPCYVPLASSGLSNSVQKAKTERKATKSNCDLHWERTFDAFEISPERHLILESYKDP